MSLSKEVEASLRYLTPNHLNEQIKQFTSGMAVTKGAFEMVVEKCTFEDMEWNHMDQMHRPFIHKTYEQGIRIAFGQDFALSLTRWGKWPFFITVTDTRVDRGLFYQTMTIAGLIFLHAIISMKQQGDNIHLKIEWYIASHRLFKFLHKFLDKKLYNLNVRLQQEDAQIRRGRFDLREKGYCFQTDQPDFYNSNISRMNTLYPELEADGFISVENCLDDLKTKKIGNLEFILKKENDIYSIWPAVCPHEGGPLSKGKFCNAQIVCPWHGLRFTPVELSQEVPRGSRYGFEYHLQYHKIYIKKCSAEGGLNKNNNMKNAIPDELNMNRQ